MLKKTVSYTDYNDVQTTDTLYFNLTKTELLDLLEIQPQLMAWQEKVSGPEREMTTPEILELIGIVRMLVEKSYGVRSSDGKRFMKSDEVLAEFRETAAYDAFVFDLFEHPEKAVEFMVNILPKDLQDADTDAEIVQLPFASAPGEKTYDDYTDEELTSMPQEQFEKLVGRDPRNMSREQLMLAMKRKSSIQ